MRRNTSNHDLKKQKTPETTQGENPIPQNPEKRKIIERSGDAKISYPRPRLKIHLRYVGLPVQTR